MTEHVIGNPVPTPEQMAKMLGVSPARVEALRGIMRSPESTSSPQRMRTGLAAKKASVFRKANVAGMKKDSSRGKAKAR